MASEQYVTVFIALVGVIVTLIGAHYISVVWEIRQLRQDIAKLRETLTTFMLSTSQSALAAAMSVIENAKHQGKESE